MSRCRYIVGEVRETLTRLGELEPGSIDLVMTSPPFLQLREYLPSDHANKAHEIGMEDHPAEFIDSLLEVTAALIPCLSPHASIVVELGDTSSGSGGAGGDYAEGGWRDGQPKFVGSGASARGSSRGDIMRKRAGGERDGQAPAQRSSADRPGGGFRVNQRAEESGTWSRKKRNLNPPPEWPLAKSLCMIPELYRCALAYGINPLTGEESPAGRWIIRNTIDWCRTNPTVGRDGDKFRRASSDLVVATRAPDRYFDGVAVRVPDTGGDGGTRPLYDWWVISTEGYEGAHYATFPVGLVEPIVKSMSPQRVCTVCGKPSERIYETTYKPHGERKDEPKGKRGLNQSGEHAQSFEHGRATAIIETTGWTECECAGGEARWRRGVVLDPFGGSGTTGEVATGLGRDAVLIDIDERNAAFAVDRVGGLFIETLTLAEMTA